MTLPPDPTDMRVRRRRKEDRPGEIIEAGLAEFAARGFQATRLEDVAQRAGIAKGTIYRYFEDKEALFVAAMRSRLSPVLTDAGGLVDAFPGTTQELIRILVRLLYQRLVDTELRVLLRVLIAESGNFPVLAEAYHREVVSRGRALIEAIVRRGVARGELRAGPATDFPLVLMGPAVMAVVWKLVFEPVDPIPTERFLEAHLDLVMNGIAAR